MIGHYCLLPRLLKARKRLSQPTGGVKQFALRQIRQTKRKGDRSRPCALEVALSAAFADLDQIRRDIGRFDEILIG
ncbi:TPA: hypothetical protein ACSP74_004097, partial [Aeromonas veronii]